METENLKTENMFKSIYILDTKNSSSVPHRQILLFNVWTWGAEADCQPQVEYCGLPLIQQVARAREYLGERLTRGFKYLDLIVMIQQAQAKPEEDATPSTACCQLLMSTVYCLLSTVNCLLSTIYWLMPDILNVSTITTSGCVIFFWLA